MNKNIVALRKMVEKKNDTVEYNTCTLKGVRNLSRSDRDMILMYLDSIEQYGAVTGLMDPRGGVREVLEKAKVL